MLFYNLSVITLVVTFTIHLHFHPSDIIHQTFDTYLDYSPLQPLQEFQLYQGTQLFRPNTIMMTFLTL